MNTPIAQIIRQQPELYLRSGYPVVESVAAAIVETMILNGVKVAKFHRDGDVCAISSDHDWISEAYPDYVFDRFVPVADIPNSFRGEILLSAFCDFYAVLRSGALVFSSGRASLIEAYIKQHSQDDYVTLIFGCKTR